jgi:hypothetical protein
MLGQPERGINLLYCQLKLLIRLFYNLLTRMNHCNLAPETCAWLHFEEFGKKISGWLIDSSGHSIHSAGTQKYAVVKHNL